MLTSTEVLALSVEALALSEGVVRLIEADGCQNAVSEAHELWRSVHDSLSKSSAGGRRITREERREIAANVVDVVHAIQDVPIADVRGVTKAAMQLLRHVIRDVAD